LALLAALVAAAPAQADREFSPRYSATVRGDVATAANQLVTCRPSTPPSTACADQQTNGGLYDNPTPGVYVDVDSDDTTVNSSSATLTVPAGATVRHASLYWGGRVPNGNYAGNVPDPALREAFGEARLAVPGTAGYQTVTAHDVDTSGGDNERTWQGVADVTDLVRSAGAGEYTVADVAIAQLSSSPGDWGGWTLVVVYEDPTLPRRSVSLFDGLLRVGGATRTVTVDGLQTPPAGQVDATMGIVAYEGDGVSARDTWQVSDLMDSPAVYAPVTDALTPEDNAFNSRITRNGAFVTDRIPAYTTTAGYDSKTVNADSWIRPGADTVALRFGSSTTGETFFPGAVFASIRLSDVEGVKDVVNVTDPGAVPQPGDRLRYTARFSNDAAAPAIGGIAITDEIPAGTSYVPGSLRVGGAVRTDAAGDDVAEYVNGPDRVVARVGSGANATDGGVLAGGESGVLRFDVVVDDAYDPIADGPIENVANASYLLDPGDPGSRVDVPSNTTTVVAPLPPVPTIDSLVPRATVGDESPVDFGCTAATGRTVASCVAVVTPPGGGPGVPVTDGGDVPTDVPGTYTITVTVVDDLGQTRETTGTYTVFPPPVATITDGPSDGGDVPAGGRIPGRFTCEVAPGLTQQSCDATITLPDGSTVPFADGDDVPTDVPGDYTITVTVEDELGKTHTVTRTYTVVAPAPPPVTTPPTPTTPQVPPVVTPDVPTQSGPALRITKRFTRTSLRPGQRTTLRIRVTNRTGRTLRNVRVCERVPAGLRLVSSTPRAKRSGGQYCWTVKTLKPGKYVNRSMTLRATNRRGRVTTRTRGTANGVSAQSRNASVRVLAPRKARPGGVTG